ncbi:prenyltransferase/squalene oxidase repeat-containing protein [Maribellus sediminis]|uniref:prenyltransferase/squalene oxidase repeat-containing protein n=1 Tax=Maribellus sediminis TaxID=2696285 RepID=UPI001430FB70|nr:prenyltransferase/squalene oxidase repeat-containing protein [Maribellus sediminis]
MKNMTDLEIRFKELSEILLSEMNENGFWSGQLSSSALGVAVAVAALHFYDADQNAAQIKAGLSWLANNLNTDGSYGDTPESPGNISTTLLVYAALNLYANEDEKIAAVQKQSADWLLTQNIDLRTGDVATAILAHYKTDYTFSVPILTMCALCGIPKKDGFQRIPQLPFELALMPQKFYRMLNLSVVSYAIPALIAVGIVILKKKRSGKIGKWIRGGAEKKALKILQKSMPESGGFLEAIPLTAFVGLSLIHAGYRDLDVVEKGIAFLKRTQREDGGWPIDIDLSTWVTTLSIKSLGNRKDEVLAEEQQNKLTKHLKSVQNKIVHPFNGTSPGGWGWTNYSGSVPDCDDTPGAILALLRLNAPENVKHEVIAGVEWLFELQNSDGGFPTFSKGWGKLPFDQSCADLTGHCLLALATARSVYKNEIPADFVLRLNNALRNAFEYLRKHQQKNGAWLPLWFGNQWEKAHQNPVYGTARVLAYLKEALLAEEDDLAFQEELATLIPLAERFLVEVQNEDGSWGGAKNINGTIEETALSVTALADSKHKNACEGGLKWLDESFSQNGLKSAPVGLYFASLWYDEKLYPLTAYLEAITKSLHTR